MGVTVNNNNRDKTARSGQTTACIKKKMAGNLVGVQLWFRHSKPENIRRTELLLHIKITVIALFAHCDATVQLTV